MLSFQVTIDIELWDCAASGGVGRKLGQASIALDLHEFEPLKAQSATVELMGKEKKASGFPVRHSTFRHMHGIKVRSMTSGCSYTLHSHSQRLHSQHFSSNSVQSAVSGIAVISGCMHVELDRAQVQHANISKLFPSPMQLADLGLQWALLLQRRQLPHHRCLERRVQHSRPAGFCATMPVDST